MPPLRQPLLLADPGKPVAVILRPGKTPDGAEVALVLRHLVRGGEVIGREPLEVSRERHRAAVAELPTQAHKMSKGYPAIVTLMLDAEGEQTFNPYAPQQA